MGGPKIGVAEASSGNVEAEVGCLWGDLDRVPGCRFYAARLGAGGKSSS